MREKKKKLIQWSALLLAMLLTVTGFPMADMTVKAETDVPEINLLARYPLQQDVNDISGNGKHGVVHGNVSYNDGMVLPGAKKTSAADASYVAIPGDVFAGRENLTISVWIKNASDKGNYAALFFGTAPQANNMPLNYWLFNPINPDGLFKSVFTNTNNADKPFNSEVGVAAGSTEAYKGKWAHYTTVLTENSVTGYINGKQVGTAVKSKKAADFGSELQAYIGRSNYVEDSTYGGSFQDLRVYEGAMTEEQIKELYFDAEYISQSVRESLLPEITAQLSLEGQIGDGVVMEAKKLELPSESQGASIEWTSDKESVISKDGQVTLPAKQETVTLTASLELGNAKNSKTFMITVLSADEKFAYVKEKLQVPYVLDNGAVLPTRVGDVSISWSGCSAVKDDGSIVADFNGKQEYQLKATLSYGKQKEEKSFRGWLLGADAGYVESYTRTPSGDCVNKLARSMFLAYSDNGKDGFAALNDDYGVLFMRAESQENETLTPKSLKDPYLFYRKDGEYGVVAVRTEENGETDKTKASSVMFYNSEDLINYDEVGFVDLRTELAVCEPVCEYDSSAGRYRITWNDGAGNYYQNTLTEISADSQASEPVKVSVADIRKEELGLSGTKQGNLLPLEHAKGQRLKNKLTKLVNTGIQVPESVKVTQEEDVQAVRATAFYNDGSTASKKVQWDLSAVDFSKPGTYTVTGTVTQPTFNNSSPLFNARPDPQMVKYNGKFYFISTDENGQGRIYIRQSDTLEGIKKSTETLLLDGNSYPSFFKTCLWAPELHVIEGELYIFFAGSLTNWSGVQSHVMQLKKGGDPMKTSDWETPIRVLDKDGNNLYDADTQGITLDMTYFEVEGQGYVVWAQRQIKPVDTGSWLYIATVDKETPWQLTSDRVEICKPDYGWDNNATFVVEGPYALQRDGKIYLTFSGAATDNTYCVGIMTASADSNLLEASSWRKGNYPILSSWSVENQYGPGHNAYIQDDDGTVYNTYHAKWSGGTRSASIRRVHFDVDGEPVLDLVEERDLLDEYKSVTMKVEVQDSSYNAKEELLELYRTYADYKEKTGQGLSSQGDWNEFCDSLEQAGEVLNRGDASQPQIVAAISRLKLAAGKLCYIVKLQIAGKPNKTSYTLGESLDTTGLKVEAVDNQGVKHSVAINDCTITGFDANKQGTKKVIVTYQGKTAEFAVTVSGGGNSTPNPPKATSITGKAAAYNSVTLKWKKVSGANGYNIYRADSKKGTYKKIKTIANGNTVTFKDSKLTFNKTYYYKIKAYKKSGNQTAESAFSKVVSVKTGLTAPVVSLKKKSKTKLNIKWKKVSGASGYKVQYSLKKKSGYKTVMIKKGKTVSYTKPGLKKGKTYYVRVCAYRTVKGKKVSGKWSAVKSIKMK